MACSKLCSQRSTILQLRSQKLVQQRSLIGEKNASKRKFSGQILPLSQTQTSSPCSHPLVLNSHLETQTQTIFRDCSNYQLSSSITRSLTPAPSRMVSLNSSDSDCQNESVESINYLQYHDQENQSEASFDDPNHFPIRDETFDFPSDATNTSPPLNAPCRDPPPALIPLSVSSFPSLMNNFNLTQFIFTPIPHYQVQCHIHRDRLGIDKNMFPIYKLYLEQPKSMRQKCILSSRKRKKSKYCNYLLTTSQQDFTRDGSGYSGKLRANFLGTEFALYSDGVNPHSNKVLPDQSNIREELCTIHYETNILGLSGPRKMNVLLPNLSKIQNIAESDISLSDSVSQNILLENNIPEWNEESQTYVLNFSGRVTQASVKNFQLIDREKRLVLQFGRIAKDEFTLDYSYPLCTIQAFGIALSSFERKFGCE